MGLWVLSSPIYLSMIVRIFVHHLANIKSDIWIISHCLMSGHETMVCTVCLAVILWMTLFFGRCYVPGYRPRSGLLTVVYPGVRPRSGLFTIVYPGVRPRNGLLDVAYPGVRPRRGLLDVVQPGVRTRTRSGLTLCTRAPGPVHILSQQRCCEINQF